MLKLIKKMSQTAGLVPGTLVHVGEKTETAAGIRVFDYNEEKVLEKKLAGAEECSSFKGTPTVSWINVDGIHDLGLIEEVGKGFNIHPLILEDIVNTGQRPKIEDMGDYIFIVLKMFYNDSKRRKDINVEQVSIILGKDFVISFQEKEGDVFDPIRERIREAKGRIRTMGTDYLAYVLLDAVIDGYFSILETFGEEVEALEQLLATNPSQNVLSVIHKLKRDTIFLRKSVWPLREIVNVLQRGDSNLVKRSNLVYFRDIYDHAIQVIDTIEATRDMVSGMLDIYLSSVSNKMNEVMKVLTIFAAIFIPLTFVAGIYGMNFRYMPELEWKWGYFAVLGLMAVIAGGLIFFFKKKKWF